MTRPYKLNLKQQLPSSHPLHWTNFWPDLQRVHRAQCVARQDLILWLANLYIGATKSGRPLGFCSIQVRLMDLRALVRDYHPALDYFFSIKQLGFHVSNENMELSTLIPKKLNIQELITLDKCTAELVYTPPELPNNSIISKVYLDKSINASDLITEVLNVNRPEIIPQLQWLLKQPSEINFHFIPSGKLKLRDTSVWPIQAIETWPGWLRARLFGGGIDLDSAYIQFLMEHLTTTFKNQPNVLKLLFPDLLRLLHDKEAFREELCLEILRKPYTDEYRTLIKKVLMSIANGSKISGALLSSGNTHSSTVTSILEVITEASVSDLMLIGNRLKRIADQFRSARKYACLEALKKEPTRINLKSIFCEYFSWERKARYALWEEIGRVGIMVHDGIEGVPEEQLHRLPEIMKVLNLKLTS
jgi:hypothetical protein